VAWVTRRPLVPTAGYDVRESPCHARCRPVPSAGTGIGVFPCLSPASQHFTGGIVLDGKER